MKKLAVLTFIFLFIATVVIYLIPVRPAVIVQNATKERVYFRAGESINGVEPSPEEVDKVMRKHPDVIEPGETLKITSSFSAIILEGYELNVGWSTGGQFEYNSTGSGGQNFHISSKSGFCSAVLTISPGYNDFELNDKVDGICLKKLQDIIPMGN
ncbi:MULTISPECIES: hypothetical protein [Pantoea]|jgi:hypothetical protein|uniref:hypothetical protein n=1 Tax=Pantoea TaxID=53335 RepID=UPI00026D22BC|nr:MULTISPECIES: hypothetical protein [Pantoea]MBD8115500.1 hypothetical protein [Pantoea agglomerans]MBD8252004.1 hypothetical protein [Pantoea agglomerans]WAB88811.1 hypothetical protein OSE17_09210 [Pantoea agglomerans]